MRDKRTMIVENVLMILVRNNVNQEVIEEVKTRLEVELAKCEVYERCTELVSVDSTPFEYLKQFLDVKYIEGKSEQTIKRYQYEIGRLLTDCKKPLNEITTNDLRLYIDYRRRTSKKKV